MYGSRQPASDSPEAPGQYPPGQQYAGYPAPSHEQFSGGGPGPLTPEVSGSLTGHILGQGRPDVSEPKPRGGRVLIIVLMTIAVLAVAAALGAVLVLSGKI